MKMKRVVLFYLVIHLFGLFPIVAFGQWEREGELEKVRASDTTLLQFVLSSDGKSIFALDYNYILRKIDVQTGEIVWEKELKNRTFNDKPLEGARIGMEGENYVLYYLVYEYYWDEGKLVFFIYNIENDSLIQTIEYEIYPDVAELRHSVFSYRKSVELSTNYLIYRGSASGVPGGKTTKYIGSANVFKINRDSVWLKGLCFGYSGNLYLKPIANRLITSGRYYTTTGPIRGEWYNSAYCCFEFYNLEDGSSVSLEKHIKLDDYVFVYLCEISNDGNLVWFQYYENLFLVDTRTNIKVITIKNSMEPSQIMSLDKYDLLFLVNNNMIRTYNSKLLEPLDTIIVPTNKNIYNFKLSPDESTFYFQTNNEIYRFKPVFRPSPLKAFFYTTSVEALVGQTIQFYNVSSGNPDSYYWDFGDGTYSTEKNPTHTYLSDGYYKPRLIVKRGNETSYYEITLTISPIIKADFEYIKDESNCPVLVRFRNTSSGKIEDITWDFGDKSTSKEVDPIHEYKVSGEYKVTLTVKSMKNSNSISKTLKINLPPISLNKENFRYEVNLNENGNYFYNAVELPDHTIIASKSNSSLVGLDSVGKVLWVKPNLSCWIVVNPYNNTTYVVSNSTIMEINSKGEVLRTYKEKENVRILCVTFDKERIYLGSGKVFLEGERLVHHEFYVTEIGRNFVVTADNKILPSFEFYNRKLLDSGVDTLPDVDLKSDEAFYMVCNLALNISKGPSGKFNYFAAIYKETFVDYIEYIDNYPNFIHKSVGYSKYIKINDYILDGYLYNFHSFRCGLDILWLEMQKVVFLNDSLLVFPAKDPNNENLIIIYNYQTRKIKPIPLPQKKYVNSILRLNDGYFAVAGLSNDDEDLTTLIYNKDGLLIHSATQHCRYGLFTHVSITPDKQLLYSGYFISSFKIDYQTSPYLLKTNFAFLNSLLKDTPIKVSPVVNDSFPLIEYPENIPFPNPTSGKFTLQLDTNEHSSKIELYDIVGNLVKTLFAGEHNSQRFDFDISDVPSGLYFVKVTQPHTTKILKIMKINN